MNMTQLAKLMAAGVLAMAAVPAISLARTHHTVHAIAPSLSATTVTPRTSTSKHTHVGLASHKHKTLSTGKKTSRALSHRGTSHRALIHGKVRHTALSSTAHKATKLSSKKAV